MIMVIIVEQSQFLLAVGVIIGIITINNDYPGGTGI